MMYGPSHRNGLNRVDIYYWKGKPNTIFPAHMCKVTSKKP